MESSVVIKYPVCAIPSDPHLLYLIYSCRYKHILSLSLPPSLGSPALQADSSQTEPQRGIYQNNVK